MRKLFRILTVPLVAVLVACGGGGGDPGTSGSGGGTGGTANNGTVTVQAYSRVTGADVAVNNFASSDPTVRARATVKDPSGNAISNVIVTFSESGPGLLAFMPGSATALTNSAGVAEIDLKAATVTSQGATQLVATTAVTSKTGTEVSLVGRQNVAISGGVVQNPQAAASAINFTNVAPSDKSIVIAGAGGNGRSEVALLTFTVVDSSGSPLQDVVVDFTAVPADSVTLNASSGTTNASGQVIATVNSKSSPTSVIIKAAVRDRSSISTQSDTLTVTTGVATPSGFDLSASKFNLDYDLSGDSSKLTVRIVDANGNPVSATQIKNHVGLTRTENDGRFVIDVDKNNPVLSIATPDDSVCEVRLDIASNRGALWLGDISCDKGDFVWQEAKGTRERDDEKDIRS